MSRAALRRALAALGSEWEKLPNGVDARKVVAFPHDRWSFVIGFVDDGVTLTNTGEGSATSLAAAVREAERLAKKQETFSQVLRGRRR